MRSIMIIGAGEGQVPLIKAALRENCHTIVCDRNPNAPGVALADDFLPVSTKDRDGLLAAAKKKNIDGVIANSDYAMGSVAYIAQNMGLVGNPEESVAVFSSKSRFRELQKRIGLFAPGFLAIDSVEHWDAAALEGFSFPIIIKPDDNSGSRGTCIIDQPNDGNGIFNSLKTAMKESRNGKAILEEYVSMPFLTAVEGEIFIHHGQILWDGLFQTRRSAKAPTLPMTYVFPLSETEEKTDSVKDTLTKAFLAAGIIHGEYNVELFFTNDGKTFLIEINPRQGGYDLPRYVREHCGIDYDRLLITTALGDDSYWESLKTFKRENRKIIHHMLFPRSKGRFRGLSIADEIKDKVFRCRTDIEIGKDIECTVDAASCIGSVDAEFDSVADQQVVSSRMEELIKVEIEQV